MKTMMTGRLWRLMALLAWLGTGATLADPPAGEDAAAGRAKAAGLGVGSAVIRLEQGVRFIVDGLAFDDVTGWLWNGKDISAPLQAALADHSAVVGVTPVGFKLDWRYPPEALGMGENGRLGLKAKSLGNGILNSAVATACPTLISFGEATKPVLKADTSCLYEREGCQPPGKPQASIDYPGTGDAVSVAAGMVVKVELTHPGDQGIGTNILVRHLLPVANCATVYSSYAHMDSVALGIAINAPVAGGQKLGVIGGSGHGKSDDYSTHLRLEIKADPGTAASAELPGIPDQQGRFDPNNFLNKTFSVGLYRQVSKGANHSCGIRSDESLSCWGDNDDGQSASPVGNFKQVSVGERHSCALRTDYALACWGWNGYGQAAPPAGRFTQVSAGGRHSCAVRTDNHVSCWGNDWWGQATPPADSFKQVSAGGYHTCAVKADDTLACWGNNTKLQASPPSGGFKQVGAGTSHACAIGMDNKLACWGDDSLGQASPPAGHFKQLDANADYNCAVRMDGFEMCWGQQAKPAP